MKIRNLRFAIANLPDDWDVQVSAWNGAGDYAGGISTSIDVVAEEETIILEYDPYRFSTLNKEVIEGEGKLLT